MYYIVRGESGFNPNTKGDTKIICDRTGEAVYARGLVQITRCYHPEITDEQAFNIDFSLKFLAEKIRAGKCLQEWTVCREFAKKYPSLKSMLLPFNST
jgi:hypothetical protein